MEELVLTPYADYSDKPMVEEAIIRIKKSDFSGHSFKDGRITFFICNCLFKNITIENSEEIDFPSISIGFFGCYIERITVQNIVSKNISIDFMSSIVSGNISSKDLASVYFNNAIIRDSFFLSETNKISISYTEENIFPRRWKTLLNRVGGEYESWLKSYQSFVITAPKEFKFYMNEVKQKKAGIYRRPHERHNEDSRTGYYLSDKQKKLLSISLIIDYVIDNKDVKTQIDDAYLWALSLSGKSRGTISINNTKVENIYLRDFNPEGELTFYNIHPYKKANVSKKIEIHKSNLDKAWFDNVYFKEYEIVSFYRSKVGNTTFTSCNFPDGIVSFEKFKTLENVHYPDINPENYDKDQYETFLQLKKALESTGNYYEAQRFQTLAHESLRKIKEVPYWDKVILKWNYYSNNHSLSIKRPFLWFIGISIVAYILYLWSLNRIFNCNEIDYSLFGQYFSFIDFTHDADFLANKEELNFKSYFLDYFSKIILGYLVYQFISAFRKYGKK